MRKIIWVETLGTANLLALLPELLLGSEIRHDENKTPSGVAWAAKLLSRVFGKRLRAAHLSLGERDASGRALNYRREALLSRAAGALCREHFPDKPSWFLAMARCFFATQLQSRATFLVMAEHAAGREAGARHVAYLPRHPANGRLLEEFLPAGWTARQSLSPRAYLRLLAAPLYVFLRAGLSLIFASPPRATASPGRPSIWIEYYPLDLTSFISRAFWRDHVDTKAFDLVFYLDRSDTPWTDEVVARIRARGFHAVDCHVPAALARLTPEDMRALAKQLFSRPSGRPLWLHLFEFHYEALWRVWISVFRRFNVKLLVQHQEYSWKQMAQAKALESAGGAMMGFHWSYYPYREEPGNLTPQHVFFVWGDDARDWLEDKGHACRHILPSGIWIRANTEPSVLVARLAPNVRYRLAIFDSGCGYDIYIASAHFESFLSSILDLLEENREWGALLKPKSVEDYLSLPETKRLTGRIERLIREKRLAILDRSVSPVSVARAADLCIGLGINSACIIAGAHGRRAIHWDCSGWLDNALESDRNLKVIYTDLQAVREAMLADSRGETVGDLGPWRRRIDSFEDGCAAERVGNFIQSYMDAVLGGTPALAALDGCARDYRARILGAKPQIKE